MNLGYGCMPGRVFRPSANSTEYVFFPAAGYRNTVQALTGAQGGIYGRRRTGWYLNSTSVGTSNYQYTNRLFLHWQTNPPIVAGTNRRIAMAARCVRNDAVGITLTQSTPPQTTVRWPANSSWFRVYAVPTVGGAAGMALRTQGAHTMHIQYRWERSTTPVGARPIQWERMPSGHLQSGVVWSQVQISANSVFLGAANHATFTNRYIRRVAIWRSIPRETNNWGSWQPIPDIPGMVLSQDFPGVPIAILPPL